MRGAAHLDPSGAYRYALRRAWGPRPERMLFVMLNPSTADAAADDPTLRRCIGCASREGFDRLEIVNLFALRASDPRALLAARDPVGPGNDRALRRAVARSADVVAAWGNGPAGARFRGLLAHRVRRFRALLGPRRARCLGRTRAGQPCHPLRLARGAPLVPWPPPEAVAPC